MPNSTPLTEAARFDHRRQAVGRRVLALIESRRMSFADAGRATGISKTGLYQIADGASDPCLSSLYKIADFFGVPVAALLGDTPAAEAGADSPADRSVFADLDKIAAAEAGAGVGDADVRLRCPQMRQPGGCQLPNVHCRAPDCWKKPRAARTPAAEVDRG